MPYPPAFVHNVVVLLACAARGGNGFTGPMVGLISRGEARTCANGEGFYRDGVGVRWCACTGRERHVSIYKLYCCCTLQQPFDLGARLRIYGIHPSGDRMTITMRLASHHAWCWRIRCSASVHNDS